MTISGPLILLAIVFALLLTGQVLITLVYGRAKHQPTTTPTDTKPIVIPTHKSEPTASTETQP